MNMDDDIKILNNKDENDDDIIEIVQVKAEMDICKVAESQDIEDLVCVDRWIGKENDEKVKIAQDELLKWYDSNRRILPWRGDESSFGEKICNLDVSDLKRHKPTPYAVWVSEIMCQQTRVETVINYFLKWMDKFPTLKDLAKATEDEVNSVWAGLGYYRRARNLHNGAKKIIEEYNGNIPDTVDELLKIPGIGPYTAGAIASICFNRRSPVVDGNVIRVFSRLSAAAIDSKDPKLAKQIWKVTSSVVPAQRPGDFNQSVMELGATVCTPCNPLCTKCPIQSICRGFSLGRQTEFPKKPVKKAVPLETYQVFVISRHLQKMPQFLLTRRPGSGLLAGQWEFPSALVNPEESITNPSSSFMSIFETVDGKLSVKIRDLNWISRGDFVHKFSHIHHCLHVFSSALPETSIAESYLMAPDGGTFQWMSEDDIHAKGLTKAMSVALTMSTKTPEIKTPGKRKSKVKTEVPSKKVSDFFGRKIEND